MTRAVCLVITIVALSIGPRVAFAQSVEAETLFREGKRLIKEGKIAEGCDKLEASNRLESSVGSLLNLADCREKNHQLATAWVTFRKAETAAKVANDVKRAAEAARRASLLDPRLPKLAIAVTEKVDGLTVARNGTAVDSALWGTGVPVDPGEYEIVASAVGFDRWTTKVTIATEGSTSDVTVPKLKRAGEATPTPKEPVGVSKPQPQSEPEPSEIEEPEVDRPSSFTTMRKIAVVVGVGGVATIGVGVTFGIKAKDRQKEADAICPEAACTNAMAVDRNKDAQRAAFTANVMFGIGAAGVVGAAVLWFVGAPKVADQPVSIAPVIGGSDAYVVVGGSF